jgi:Na+/H+ antiporter NhaD/arsenite permease-like protein
VPARRPRDRAGAEEDGRMTLTAHWIGLAAIGTFLVAYAAVATEERLHLRKSVPVLVAAGAIWVLVGVGYALDGRGEAVAELARHNLLDYAELLLFLIVAMTYVNTLEERGVFDAVRAWLVGRGLSLRALFWATGGLAFALSPIADNLTTALVLGAVATAVGQGNPRFVALASINVVVAANAGGAFSPFGDITTLMVWQKGVVPFGTFFRLLVPSLVNWLVPAALMSLALERAQPRPSTERAALEDGAVAVGLLFLATIALTVTLHSALHLPPAVGMMTGLGGLQLYSYVHNLRARQHRELDEPHDVFASPALADAFDHARGTRVGGHKPLQTFRQMERVEWDTLMFFYGVVLCVGGLGALGYLDLVSRFLYVGLGPTLANVLVGVLSAVVDNVPVMFAVLSMNPEMSQGQWLLVTLAAGVGGSLLSFGSAAGVALMGQARGGYTFLAHLRWSWAIALGYAASVLVHLVVNADMLA